MRLREDYSESTRRTCYPLLQLRSLELEKERASWKPRVSKVNENYQRDMRLVTNERDKASQKMSVHSDDPLYIIIICT